MDIQSIKITGMHPFAEDITSCHDAYPVSRVVYVEVSAIVSVRNDDIPPFEIKIKVPPTEKNAEAYIENVLFELS